MSAAFPDLQSLSTAKEIPVPHPESDPSDSIVERIRRFRKSCPGCQTQKDFAEALGIDQQRLSGYENGARVPHHVIASMVRMGANPYWLLFGEGEMRGAPGLGESVREMSLKAVNLSDAPVEDRQLAEFYILPLYADEVAAGQPRDVRDAEIEGPAILHRAWCPHPRDTDYVRVHSTGDSMAPAIPPGSMVTVDRAENDPEKLVGKIVAIGLREGGVTLKRLQRAERGGFVGVPDNPSPTNKAIPLAEGDRVIGLVQTVHARLG